MQDDHSRTISDIFESLEHDRTLGDSVSSEALRR
jgi:hypothetical protein